MVSWHNPLHCKLAAPLVRPDGTIISKQRGKPQDPFSVYAALEHNGDYGAATAAVKAMKGCVPPEAVRNSSKARAAVKPIVGVVQRGDLLTELLSATLPPIRFIYRDIVPAEGVLMLAVRPKSGEVVADL